MAFPSVCPSCGAALQPGTKFCTECGALIEAPADAAAAAEAAAQETEAVFGAPFAQAAPAFGEPAPAAEEPAFAQPSPAETLPQEVWSPDREEAKPAGAYPPVPAASAVPAPAAPAPAAPAADADRPGKKSPYAPMTAWGMALELFLMSIPVVGFILMIVWSCGVCRKLARRNLARAYLILLIFAVALAVIAAILGRFVFFDEITKFFESVVPGYTIQIS